MKTKGFIMVAMFILCVLSTHGVLAETKGYIDTGQDSLTGKGVVGARYDGSTYYGSAIYGLAQSTTGSTIGGNFENNSTSGIGVRGFASATTGSTTGGHFQSNSTSGIGVQGVATATSGVTFGGQFQSNSTSGRGVWGYATATTGFAYGGWFQNDSTSGAGVRGVASATTGSAYGGWFISNAGIGVLGQGNTYGGHFQSNSTSGIGLQGFASATTGTNYGLYGQTNSPSGYGVYSKGNMKVEGNFMVTGGAKSAVVKLKDGKSISLYAVESSENWFEDFGSAKLKDGKAVVQIEPTFAETVNTSIEYHVFLTPKGDCRGLYVTNETGTSFEVRELNGGKSAIPFSYRIVVKRKGYEGQRLVKVDVDETTTVATQRESHGK